MIEMTPLYRQWRRDLIVAGHKRYVDNQENLGLQDSKTNPQKNEEEEEPPIELTAEEKALCGIF